MKRYLVKAFYDKEVWIDIEVYVEAPNKVEAKTTFELKYSKYKISSIKKASSS